MIVEFSGVRGSIPRPLNAIELSDRLCSLSDSDSITKERIRELAKSGQLSYGGNTACVHLHNGEDSLIVDAGSGLRTLSQRYIKSDRDIHILITHLHWDHIHGMPFFAPFYIGGKNIHIHSPIPTEAVENCLKDQWKSPYFPMNYSDLLAKVHFHHFEKNTEIGPFEIEAIRLAHPDTTYGYSIECSGKSYVHFSDVELRGLKQTQIDDYRHFLKGADLLVADTQFDLEEIESFKTWGHSCAESFIELFGDCEIKNLAMFHYNPQESEAKIDQLYRLAKNKAKKHSPSMNVIPAVEGQTIQL